MLFRRIVMMTHGIIGKAEVRKFRRSEGKDECSDGFHAVGYISATRVYFSITRSEAGQITLIGVRDDAENEISG